MGHLNTLSLIAPLLVVALFLIESTFPQSFPQESAENSIDLHQLSNQKIITDDSQCGGVLESSTEPNFLSYKFRKSINRYESCIWTVHAANRRLIKLSNIRTYFRYPDNIQNFISVGVFNESNYDNVDSLIWTKLPFSFTSQSVDVPGPVAFIHFASTYFHPGLGFRLTFQSEGEESSCLIFNNFENYFVEGNAGLFEYPVGEGMYRNNQRTTIVLKADPTLSMENREFYTIMYMVNEGIEGSNDCIADNLNVYSYDSARDQWNRNKQMCGSTPSRDYVTIRHPRIDPLIITFKSDDTGVGAGFYFFWANNIY